VISPSFADIFYNNCFKNGLLPIRLDSNNVEKLFKNSSEIEIDLQNQTITTGDIVIPFEIEIHRKKTLLEGLDDIAITLQYEGKITMYEQSKSKF